MSWNNYSLAPGATLSTVINGSNVTQASGKETEEEEEPGWHFAFSVTMATILSVAAFLAVAGNAMVLTVVIRHRGMRTRTNLFLVNLAVADFLVGLTVMPFTITTLIEQRWIFGLGTFCNINGWLNAFCLVASIHTLMYISVHKHYSITKPLANHFKLRQIVGMMAASWVWAAVCAFINVAGFTVRYKPGTTHCGPEYPNSTKTYIFHGIIQVSCIFIPVIVLGYCYTGMFKAIRAHSKRLQQNSTLEQDIILAQQKKVTITLFIVLAAFVICALPFNLYTTYATIQKDKHFSPYLNPVAYAFLYLNSALNPIIYAFRSPSFREGYKEILCQTPTYVISDDSAADVTSRNRLSSFFSSLRRASTSSSVRAPSMHRQSCASLSSLISVWGSTTPSSFPSGGGGKRQKGMAGMIRASRRFTTQSSVICQNGDVIIVKGGKIVSIRREETMKGVGGVGASPESVRPAHRVKDALWGASTPTPSATPTAAPNFPVEADSRGGTPYPPPAPPAAPASRRWGSLSSEGSDEVFDGSSGSCSSEGAESSCSDLLTGSLLDIIAGDTQRLLSADSDRDHVTADQSDVTLPLCFPQPADADCGDSDRDEVCRGQERVGLLISLDEDNSVLDVLPLSPLTRQRITRSAVDLTGEGGGWWSGSTPAQGPPPAGRGSQRRLPDLKGGYLPLNLKRSSSEFDVRNSGGSQRLEPFV